MFKMKPVQKKLHLPNSESSLLSKNNLDPTRYKNHKRTLFRFNDAHGRNVLISWLLFTEKYKIRWQINQQLYHYYVHSWQGIQMFQQGFYIYMYV